MSTRQVKRGPKKSRPCRDEREYRLRLRAREAVAHWIGIANQGLKPSQKILVPAIRFDLTGTCAGMAVSPHGAGRYDRRLVRINADLLAANPVETIRQVLPHEVAHVTTSALWESPRPHGPEWKSVMAYFGKPAAVCHSMDVTSVRRGKQHPYRCDCEAVQYLGSVRHKRVITGRYRYACPRCRVTLIPANDLPPIRNGAPVSA